MSEKKDNLKAKEMEKQVEEQRKKLEKELKELEKEEDIDVNEKSQEENDKSEDEKENEKNQKESQEGEESSEKIKEKPKGKAKTEDDIHEDERLARSLEDPFDGKVLIEDDLHDESLDEEEEIDPLLDDEKQQEWHQAIIEDRERTRQSFIEYHREQERFQKLFDERTKKDPYDVEDPYSVKNLYDVETSSKTEESLKESQSPKANDKFDKIKNKDFIEIDGVKVKVQKVDTKDSDLNKKPNVLLSEDALKRYYSGAYKKTLEKKNNEIKSLGLEKSKKENLLDNKFIYSNNKSVKNAIVNTAIKGKPIKDAMKKSRFTPEQLAAIKKVNRNLALNKALINKIDFEELSNIVSSPKGIDDKKLDKILGIDKNTKNNKKSINRRRVQGVARKARKQKLNEASRKNLERNRRFAKLSYAESNGMGAISPVQASSKNLAYSELSRMSDIANASAAYNVYANKVFSKSQYKRALREHRNANNPSLYQGRRLNKAFAGRSKFNRASVSNRKELKRSEMEKRKEFFNYLEQSNNNSNTQNLVLNSQGSHRINRQINRELYSYQRNRRKIQNTINKNKTDGSKGLISKNKSLKENDLYYEFQNGKKRYSKPLLEGKGIEKKSDVTSNVIKGTIVTKDSVITKKEANAKNKSKALTSDEKAKIQKNARRFKKDNIIKDKVNSPHGSMSHLEFQEKARQFKKNTEFQRRNINSEKGDLNKFKENSSLERQVAQRHRFNIKSNVRKNQESLKTKPGSFTSGIDSVNTKKEDSAFNATLSGSDKYKLGTISKDKDGVRHKPSSNKDRGLVKRFYASESGAAKINAYQTRAIKQRRKLEQQRVKSNNVRARSRARALEVNRRVAAKNAYLSNKGSAYKAIGLGTSGIASITRKSNSSYNASALRGSNRYDDVALRKSREALRKNKLKEKERQASFRRTNQIGRAAESSTYNDKVFTNKDKYSLDEKIEEKRIRDRKFVSKGRSHLSDGRVKTKDEMVEKKIRDQKIADNIKNKASEMSSAKSKNEISDPANMAIDKAYDYGNKEYETEEGKNFKKLEGKFRKHALKEGSLSSQVFNELATNKVHGKGIVASTPKSSDLPIKAAKGKQNLQMNKLDVVKGRNGKMTLARDAEVLKSNNLESGLMKRERIESKFNNQNRFSKLKSNLELENKLNAKQTKSATELYYDDKYKRGTDIGGKRGQDLLINKIDSPYNRSTKDKVSGKRPMNDGKILSKSNRVTKSDKISMGSGNPNLTSNSNTFSSFLDKSKNQRRMFDRYQSKNAIGKFASPLNMGGASGANAFAPNPFLKAAKDSLAKRTMTATIVKKGLSSLAIGGAAASSFSVGTVGPTNKAHQDINHHFDAIMAKFQTEDDKSFTQDVVDTTKARLRVYYKQINEEDVSDEELRKAGNDIVPIKKLKVRKATLNGEEINPNSFDLYKLHGAKLFGGTVEEVNIKFRYVKEDWETLIGKDNFILDEYSDIRFPDGTGGDMAPPSTDSMGGGFIVGSLRGEGNKKQIWNFFKDQGFTDAAVAGIMGNFALESGLNPAQLQLGGGPGHGLAQWEGPRWTDLQNKAAQWGGNWSDLDIQLKFIMYELKSMPSLVSYLRTATDPVDATIKFERTFERAGVPAHDQRIMHAKSIFAERDSLYEPKDSSNEDVVEELVGFGQNIRDFLLPTAYADPDDDVIDYDDEDLDTLITEDDESEKEKEEEKENDDENDENLDSSNNVIGLGMMSSDERNGQIVFLKDVLSLSALGGLHDDFDTEDITEYKKYCLDIVDFAISGEGVNGKEPTVKVDFVTQDITDSEGNFIRRIVKATVNLNVMSDLRTLEENDKNFVDSWDLQIGSNGEAVRGSKNGDKYGDRMPQNFMALYSKDFNQIFCVDIQPSYLGSVQSLGNFNMMPGIFDGQTGIPYLDWAIAIAEDDENYGYGWDGRDGNPNYDCSSLVYWSLKNAGFPLSGNSAFSTHGMRNELARHGFRVYRWHEAGELQPGDIFLDEQTHTEMYLGGGMTVAAHINEHGGVYGGAKGDQTGNEISVAKYYGRQYEYIIRPPESYMTKVKAKREEEQRKKKEKEDREKREREERKEKERKKKEEENKPIFDIDLGNLI